jgi:hypothetical protein
MKRYRTRLEHCVRIVLPLASAAVLAGCEEDQTPSAPYVPLTQPLTLAWIGPSARFEAAAALRVDWTVVIESVPVPPNTIRARHRSSFAAQEMILFTWDQHANTGTVDFSPGDSCVATVSYPQLDPAEPGARLAFRLP